jgi:hypothetical protein
MMKKIIAILVLSVLSVNVFAQADYKMCLHNGSPYTTISISDSCTDYTGTDFDLPSNTSIHVHYGDNSKAYDINSANGGVPSNSVHNVNHCRITDVLVGYD